MVNQKTKSGKTYFICSECRLAYSDQKIAKSCEDWCKRTNSCNLEIIKHAVKID